MIFRWFFFSQSVVLNEDDDSDFAADYSDAIGPMVHPTTSSTTTSISQVNLKIVPLTNSGTHERTIRNIGWTSDGFGLALASFDATGSVWTEGENGEWKCRAKLEGHDNEV